MALPKVCGIETEYGIVVRGGDNNPVSASSMLINAYVAATNRDRGRVGWDFEDEQPANDARGFELDASLAPEVETMLVNAVLTKLGMQREGLLRHDLLIGDEWRDSALYAVLEDDWDAEAVYL